MTTTVRLQRVHDALADATGALEPQPGQALVLVDRLWPRGVRKDRLAHVRWDREIAPSDELRRAYHGEQIDHETFSRRYRAELEESGAARDLVREAREADWREIVLLVAAKDVRASQGEVLAHVLRGLLSAA